MNKVKQIAFIGVYVAIIIAFQTLLSSINGLELTTLLITTAALLLPLSTSLTIVVVYCLIQGILYGFGDWLVVYIIYWTLINLISYLLRSFLRKHLILNSILNGVYGFLLGIFFFFKTLILYDLSSAISYYLTGLSGDIFHTIINILVTLILYPVMARIFPKIIKIKTKKV